MRTVTWTCDECGRGWRQDQRPDEFIIVNLPQHASAGLCSRECLHAWSRDPEKTVDPDEPQGWERIGVVQDAGGGQVTVVVHADLDAYPEVGESLFRREFTKALRNGPR